MLWRVRSAVTITKWCFVNIRDTDIAIELIFFSCFSFYLASYRKKSSKTYEQQKKTARKKIYRRPSDQARTHPALYAHDDVNDI